MIGVGLGVGHVFGWSWQAAALLGGAFAISSSIVALKTLIARGEGSSPQAATSLGISVVQDLALVPMVAPLAALPSARGSCELRWRISGEYQYVGKPYVFAHTPQFAPWRST